jgi:hypothetical protein
MTAADLDQLGFDDSTQDGDVLTVKCSQCAAAVISGVPCHEIGCPHQTGRCAECDAIIPHTRHLCADCAEVDEDATACGECGGPLWGDTCDPWHCGNTDDPDGDAFPSCDDEAGR